MLDKTFLRSTLASAGTVAAKDPGKRKLRKKTYIKEGLGKISSSPITARSKFSMRMILPHFISLHSL